MSINSLISIKNPIVDAQMQLGLDTMQDIPLFTRWATLAEKEISSYFQFVKKRKVIDICGCTAILPCDAYELQCAVLGDMGESCEDLVGAICGCGGGTAFSTTAVVGSFLIVDIGFDFTNYLGVLPYVIQNNKVILNQNYDGQKLTIQYLGYESDDEGFLMVGQNHVNAINCYIRYNYHLRRMAKVGATYLDRDLMREAKEEWNRECANARAKDGKPTPSEQIEMANMVSDPLIGNGLRIGIFNDLYANNWY